ncbi:protein kinase [Emericellopsis cladophorae]|uniref:Protein kinase n=1 Tax=Emericellopsis cladophorae TaxID=2686198 RepID=A0A9Q0BHE7_9HYPO|nr:protein kinase [Emericellopsis cladophorae]KAI6785987.1 protein kinase [Emericellopsis cladophorae]
MLIQTPSGLDQLSVEQFLEKFHEPMKVPITRTDGQLLTPHLPPYAALRIDMTKAARKSPVKDAQGFVLADFGEAFSPAEEPRLNQDNHTLLPGQPPGTLFEPDAHVSPASDVWTMATAIREILGMKSPFSQHVPPNELLAEHLDVLGCESLPHDWRAIWERQEVDGESWEEFNQTFRRKRETTGISGEEESRAVLELMRGMLRYRPQDRLTADEVLRSEWMVKGALPQTG